VLNHAEAGVIEISAKVLGGTVELKVRDNGEGIRPSTGRAGVGLSNVAERLRTLFGNGARLSLDSLSTGGTEATITMPLRVGTE
jgi:LytS/YehU family sensor histidine kinase